MRREVDLLEALRWAKNELDHFIDETACCYKQCRSCKAIKDNPLWHEWWNEGYNPVDAVLAGEELKRDV